MAGDQEARAETRGGAVRYVEVWCGAGEGAEEHMAAAGRARGGVCKGRTTQAGSAAGKQVC